MNGKLWRIEPCPRNRRRMGQGHSDDDVFGPSPDLSGVGKRIHAALIPGLFPQPFTRRAREGRASSIHAPKDVYSSRSIRREWCIFAVPSLLTRFVSPSKVLRQTMSSTFLVTNPHKSIKTPPEARQPRVQTFITVIRLAMGYLDTFTHQKESCESLAIIASTNRPTRPSEDAFETPSRVSRSSGTRARHQVRNPFIHKTIMAVVSVSSEGRDTDLATLASLVGSNVYMAEPPRSSPFRKYPKVGVSFASKPYPRTLDDSNSLPSLMFGRPCLDSDVES
nr:hypothetical protein CFP56_11046 [Quercus suber]